MKMEYPTVLGILAGFFALVGALAFGLNLFSPEPPPKGGIKQTKAKVSFAAFRRARSAPAIESNHETILAKRRTA
jgi:hypothetical protein